MITNLLWLSMCIYFEARGETEAGQIAVAHVVMNRVERRGLSVKDVVTQPRQFSWYDPNKHIVIGNINAYIRATEAAYECLDERMNGKTLRGCDHYHATWLERVPYWANEMDEVMIVGQHIFYRS